MKCQICGAEIPAGSKTCPACGAEITTGGHRKLIIILISVLIGLAAGIAGAWYALDGGWTPKENDVYYKDSYTVSDKDAAKASSRVVATMEGKELTNGLLQVYYWTQFYDFVNYYSGNTGTLPASIGLDLEKPLDQQVMSQTDITWEQYFLDVALETWKRYQALGLMAEQEGYTLDQEYQDYLKELPESLDKQAVTDGYSGFQEKLEEMMGPGCSVEDYLQYLEIYYYGLQYFNDYYEKLDPTQEEIQAFFQEHEAEFAEIGVKQDDSRLVDVRHILIVPEGGTADEKGGKTYSEEEWAACLEEAQGILDSWLAGEKTEESFAALATEKSEDPGSVQEGGLYTNVYQGYMVEEFDQWCFDESRKAGDYGLVKTPYGYHIMYFVSSSPAWQVYSRENLKTSMGNDFVEQTMEKYTMDVTYKNIVLGAVELN